MEINISSKLLERMWVTLEKAGGSIFRTWIIKRDARAQLHIDNLRELAHIQLENGRVC